MALISNKRTNQSQSSKVKITSDGSWSNTHIMVGDKELRASKLWIEVGSGNVLKATMEIGVDELELEFLENQTTVIIKEYP